MIGKNKKKNNKGKDNREMGNKDVRQNVTLKKRLEDFFYSDTPTATATKFLLMFVGIGAVVCGGAIVPGVLKAIDGFGMPEKKSKKYSRKQIDNAFANLKRQKLVEIIKEKDGRMHVKLTNKGKKRIVEFSIGTVRIKKPRKWDGKWRVLMFDIPMKPELYNQAREALRNKVKDLGFVQLQKSAWVCPYECEDELLFIAEIYHVAKYIEVLTVEKLLHENILKRKFKL
jgi:DNA-binding transcriptional regulator PaaX